ncbi:hypothetical protein BDN72DRAFT_767968 [Pluteus cervinus]|uniref:Uncharacterized protein n=1 Tax=Pluteus cervinus TaxID=181527 RepID=A0ACD3AUG2_9AGAR|nr:hypothetical protein BDN72DRAFT_767968 [Pluteus cervinus]
MQSRECQRAAWKNGHKEVCKPFPQEASMDPSSPERIENFIDKQLSRWVDTWKWTLYAFGMLALDLSNHPEDYHMTHTYVYT